MPEKIAVVYKTKYGSSQTYARWIAEETGADLYTQRKAGIETLGTYEVIVYVGSLYAGGMLGLSLISKNIEKLKDKHIVVCSVGATFGEEHNIESIKKENFSSQMLEAENIKYFHLQGSLDYKRMSLFHKFLMYLLYKKVQKMKPEERDKDADAILGTYGKTVNMTKRANIEPVVAHIKAL